MPPVSEQIRVAENVLSKQGIGAWPTCGSQGGAPFAGIGTPTGGGLPSTGRLVSGQVPDSDHQRISVGHSARVILRA